jgi:hypothetical protein
MKRGEVYISTLDFPPDGSMVDPALARFEASWQDESHPDGVLEIAEFEGAEAAVAWARERSDVVWIRLGNTGDTYFSAGEEHPEEPGSPPFPRWPPSVPPPGGWWRSPPKPTFEEVEAVLRRLRAGDLSADEADAWARERLHQEYEPPIEGSTLRVMATLLREMPDPR